MRSPINNGDFFTPLGQPFTVLTDDGQVLHCKRWQQNAKAIHTFHSNAEMGLYFRNRLGLPSEQLVKKADLTRYGRYDVCFYKLNIDSYYMDFAKP